jgi:hypothetical protein
MLASEHDPMTTAPLDNVTQVEFQDAMGEIGARFDALERIVVSLVEYADRHETRLDRVDERLTRVDERLTRIDGQLGALLAHFGVEEPDDHPDSNA